MIKKKSARAAFLFGQILQKYKRFFAQNSLPDSRCATLQLFELTTNMHHKSRNSQVNVKQRKKYFSDKKISSLQQGCRLLLPFNHTSQFSWLQFKLASDIYLPFLISLMLVNIHKSRIKGVLDTQRETNSSLGVRCL